MSNLKKVELQSQIDDIKNRTMLERSDAKVKVVDRTDFKPGTNPTIENVTMSSLTPKSRIDSIGKDFVVFVDIDRKARFIKGDVDWSSFHKFWNEDLSLVMTGDSSSYTFYE